MARERIDPIGSEGDVDLELIEFLEADLLPDGAQAGFKEQLRSHLRELLRERGVLRQQNAEKDRRGGSGSSS